MFRLLYDNAGGRSIGNAICVAVTPGENYSIGEALTITAGKATKCTATTKPTHMCVRDQKADAEPTVLVYPISGTMVFETHITAAPTGLATGSKVTLSADALGVTATTTSGVCEIVDVRNAAAGDLVTVKF